MGIDIGIGFVFAVVIVQNKIQNQMFEHVGMVAGVKCMTVAEHGAAKCENSGHCNGCAAIKHETSVVRCVLDKNQDSRDLNVNP